MAPWILLVGLGMAADGAWGGEAVVNSLGMTFVAVPGTKIWMCTHETRKGDYAAYAKENPKTDMSWKKIEAYQGNTLDRLHWPNLTERVFESSVTFIKLDGASRTLPNDCSKSANLEQEMASLLGEMLRDSMIAAIASHELDLLPKAPGFMIGIEELNGNYGWLSDGTTL